MHEAAILSFFNDDFLSLFINDCLMCALVFRTQVGALWSCMLSVTSFLMCTSQRLSSIGFPTPACVLCGCTTDCKFVSMWV